jgi:hypothetical protein
MWIEFQRGLGEYSGGGCPVGRERSKGEEQGIPKNYGIGEIRSFEDRDKSE